MAGLLRGIFIAPLLATLVINVMEEEEKSFFEKIIEKRYKPYEGKFLENVELI